VGAQNGAAKKAAKLISCLLFGQQMANGSSAMNLIKTHCSIMQTPGHLKGKYVYFKHWHNVYLA